MTSNKTYNGWANSFTWLVNLHEIVDDESAAILVANVAGMEREQAVGTLAANIKEYVEELLDDVGDTPANMFVSDMFNHAMDMVDWYELADAMIADHPDEFNEVDDEDDEE